MSQKNSNTTSNPIEWNEAVNLIHRLYNDGQYVMSVFIGLGIFTGLRVSDLKRITWSMIINDPQFEIVEQKTGKRREIRINKGFQKHVKECYKMLGICDPDAICLSSRGNEPYSTQRLNVLLKQIRDRYKVKCAHISCHSLRKTWAVKIYKESSENASMALAVLSRMMNHASVSQTMTYLGITKEQMLDTYELLTF